MLVLGGNQHDTILIEYPEPTSKGVEYFVPIAYQKFAEKETRNSVGFGEASAIMASKCDRFGQFHSVKRRDDSHHLHDSPSRGYSIFYDSHQHQEPM